MDNNLDTIFAAMADQTRRAVIEKLLTGPASVSDLHAGHAMALPSFMKHLKKLEDAGLVRSTKTGRTRTVEIAPEPLSQAERWLSQQRALWQGRIDRLQTLAEALERPKQ